MRYKTVALGIFILLNLTLVKRVSGQNAISNLISTLKIVTRLCYFPKVNSEKVARGFIGCYDYAPVKRNTNFSLLVIY